MLSAEQHKTIIETLKPYNPRRIAIFGSYARNENQPGSDLDILVDFYQTVNLFDIVGIEQDLAEQLGIKVDLVTEASMHPKIRHRIIREMKVIHE